MSNTGSSTVSCSLMFQGTASDVGKSTVVAALARLFKNRGVNVAPFKPQNMALNSAVTPEGGEIGRAQALQAQACGIDSHVDMNPVLLKPSSDKNCQVIVCGKAIDTMGAWGFHDYKKKALPFVIQAFERLSERYETIFIEGAGSPAEINLRDNDIANMGFAEAIDCPVVLVADIDKGGVFAQLVGTLDLLSESERNRVQGFIINKFRGDISLLQPGLEWLENKTGKKVIGVLPYLHELFIDAEDAIDGKQRLEKTGPALKVVVPVFTRMSNHTDFDALRLHPNVDLIYAEQGKPLPAADLIILPGTKNVRADLKRLKHNKWDKDIERHLRYGGKLLGICGGFQMLGRRIIDSKGIEDEAGEEEGLSYLNFETHLREQKQLEQVLAKFHQPEFSSKREFSAYEIHCGQNYGPGLNKAFASVKTSHSYYMDGAVSDDGQIAGSYLHGLFDDSDSCRAVMTWAGLTSVSQYENVKQQNEKQLDRLADMCERHLDIDFIHDLLAGSV